MNNNENNLYNKDFRAKLRKNPGFAMKELLYDDVEYKVFESSKSITYIVMPYIVDSSDLDKILAAADVPTGSAGTIGSIGTIATAASAVGTLSTFSSAGTAGTVGTVSSKH